MNPHQQQDYRVRFDWGVDGARAVPGDLVVVVDVLSFSTTVSIALDRGVTVWPYPWEPAEAPAFAAARDAVLAGGRRTAGPAELSLSPASIRDCRQPPDRLVLPSPNGSTICYHLAETRSQCVVACLRNAAAVAGWLISQPTSPHRPSVTVIAAGERWAGDGLRPAVEDSWGAGCLIDALAAGGWVERSPEADTARAGYLAVADRLPAALAGCASGRELIAAGFGQDVAIAAELAGSQSVPVLRAGRF